MASDKERDSFGDIVRGGFPEFPHDRMLPECVTAFKFLMQRFDEGLAGIREQVCGFRGEIFGENGPLNVKSRILTEVRIDRIVRIHAALSWILAAMLLAIVGGFVGMIFWVIQMRLAAGI